MTQQETAALMAMLRAVWTEAPVNTETIRVWTWAFEDVPYSLAEDAAKRYIRTGKWFPKPAELLELIGVQSVAPDLVPEAAWSEVIREIRRVGWNRPPVWSDGGFQEPLRLEFSSPLIAQAVESVGWQTICHSDKPEIVRAQFLATLKALMTRSVRDVQTGDAPAVPAIEDRADIVAIDGGRRIGGVA